MSCHKCNEPQPAGDVATLNRLGWEDPVYINDFTFNGTVTRQTHYCPRHARYWRPSYWTRRFQWRIGRISKWFSSTSWCLRCRTTWTFVHYHVTLFTDDAAGCSGAFPLCVKCWEQLTPRQRLPYYRTLLARAGEPLSKSQWQAIETEVLMEGIDSTSEMRVRVQQLRAER